MPRTVKVPNVPADKVAEETQNLKNAGATSVVATPQADGKVTLTATFPD